jgi:ABC-type antimicrobial peptide transport system permease subunit
MGLLSFLDLVFKLIFFLFNCWFTLIKFFYPIILSVGWNDESSEESSCITGGITISFLESFVHGVGVIIGVEQYIGLWVYSGRFFNDDLKENILKLELIVEGFGEGLCLNFYVYLSDSLY